MSEPVTSPPAVVRALAGELAVLGWVEDLLVAGSLATGDHVAGVSDLDLVAVVAGAIDPTRIRQLTELHQSLDAGLAAGAKLGCTYVETGRVLDDSHLHPTWTHGVLVRRRLSGITQAELVRHGATVFGRAPLELWPSMSDDDVRSAARRELGGYWARAAQRPAVWLDPSMVDLGLTSMARGRHAIRTGQLLTKTAAVEQARAPDWLRDELRARRRGEPVRSPRLRSAWIAWRDARATALPLLDVTW